MYISCSDLYTNLWMNVDVHQGQVKHSYRDFVDR